MVERQVILHDVEEEKDMSPVKIRKRKKKDKMYVENKKKNQFVDP